MKQRFIAFLCLCSLFYLSGCVASSSYIDDTQVDAVVEHEQQEEILLTIDGFPVTTEEFQLFLRGERSATAQYFYDTYGAQATGDFWTTDFNGERPDEHCKQAALKELLSFKMPLIIAKQRELIDHIDFSNLLSQMEEKNNALAARIAAGDIVYGLSSFDPLQYLLYVSSDCQLKLQNNEIERLTETLSDDELMTFYLDNLEQYSLGANAQYERINLPLSDDEVMILSQTLSQYPELSLRELEAQGILPEGTVVETVQSDQQEIGKDDFWEQQVLEAALTLPLNQLSAPLPTADGLTFIYVTDRVQLGYLPFDEVKSTVIYYAARQSLIELTAARIANADIIMSDTVYQELTVS